MENKYLIWSWEHDAWWAPNERGYVEDSRDAGEYSFEDAQRICLGANRSFFLDHTGNKMPNEAMVPLKNTP